MQKSETATVPGSNPTTSAARPVVTSTTTAPRCKVLLVVGLVLGFVALPSLAELEVYPPPLQSEARDHFGIDGYRYERDGDVLTVHAYKGVDLYGTIVVQWGDGQAQIDHTTLDGHPYRYFHGVDWVGYRFVDLETGEEAEQRHVPDPAKPRFGRREIVAPNDAERERRMAFLVKTKSVHQFMNWVYVDALINLRLTPQFEGPRFHYEKDPGGARIAIPQGQQREPESEGESQTFEKMVHLETCPPECFGPIGTASAVGAGSAFACCTWARAAVNAGCRNSLCLDCCAYSACEPDCDIFGGDCYCHITGTECSPGSGGEGPPGIINFCDPGEWPPECT